MFFIFPLFFKDYSLTSIVFVVTLFVNNCASDCYGLAIFVSSLALFEGLCSCIQNNQRGPAPDSVATKT
jgi:hypothetical protein